MVLILGADHNLKERGQFTDKILYCPGADHLHKKSQLIKALFSQLLVTIVETRVYKRTNFRYHLKDIVTLTLPYIQRRIGLCNYLTPSSLIHVFTTKTSKWNNIRLKNRKDSVLKLNAWDVPTFIEVFADGEYKLLTSQSNNDIRIIVDCGANVGLFAIWCSHHFPHATVICHEPVQRNRTLGVQNTNGLRLVTWKDTAVSNKFGNVTFTDEGPGSTILWDGYTRATQNNVSVIDIIEEYSECSIDILKLDVEGSEYSIIGDDRFIGWSKQVRCIALEWHNNGQIDGISPETWCIERLRLCGYSIHIGNNHSDWSGLVFGTRDT